jgi:hypothetical protein
MTEIKVFPKTQRLMVGMSEEFKGVIVRSKTQRILVESNKAISVVNAGPIGPGITDAVSQEVFEAHIIAETQARQENILVTVLQHKIEIGAHSADKISYDNSYFVIEYGIDEVPNVQEALTELYSAFIMLFYNMTPYYGFISSDVQPGDRLILSEQPNEFGGKLLIKDATTFVKSSTLTNTGIGFLDATNDLEIERPSEFAQYIWYVSQPVDVPINRQPGDLVLAVG